jgi:DNA-binding CsgD family transcriptional regulator
MIFQRVAPIDCFESTLSARQLTCLALAAEGLTSKEIARRINLSPSTVDNHIRTASARLGVKGRREAVRLMADVGSGRTIGDAEPTNLVPDFRVRLSLPPLGGKPNTMSSFEKLTAVVQIALVGTMVLAAMIFTISGLVQILNHK